MSARRRTSSLKLGLSTALVAASLASASFAPASSTALGDAATEIDPALAPQLARGPAPALFTFDEREGTRREIASFLETRGVDVHLFERVDVGVACAGSMADVRSLAAAPGTRYVSANHALTPATDSSVPTAFGGPPKQIWQGLGVTGKGVGLAVLDTGIDATHPDLELGRRTKINVRVLYSHREILGPGSEGLPYACFDAYSEDVRSGVRELTGEELPQIRDTETTSGHGTHIAGVSAGDGTASGGIYRGVAPDADIVGIAVTDSVHANPRVVDPTTGYDVVWPSTLGAVAGINYILLHGLDAELPVKVVLAGWTQDMLFDPWTPLAYALQSLHDFGINIVFPVGNEGPATSDCSAVETCHINPWLANPQTIGVAASPKTSRTRLEEYSSRGDPVEREFRDERGFYLPTITAPGTGVVSARRLGLAPYAHAPGSIEGSRPSISSARDFRFDRYYQAMSGTSVAAAHVAGTIALMQQAAIDVKECYLMPWQVKEILQQSATPMPGYSQHQVGAGMLDATTAVHLARSAPLIRPAWPETWMCPER